MRTSQQFILADYEVLKKKKIYINSLYFYKVTNKYFLKKYNKKKIVSPILKKQPKKQKKRETIS